MDKHNISIVNVNSLIKKLEPLSKFFPIEQVEKYWCLYYKGDKLQKRLEKAIKDLYKSLIFLRDKIDHIDFQAYIKSKITVADVDVLINDIGDYDSEVKTLIKVVNCSNFIDIVYKNACDSANLMGKNKVVEICNEITEELKSVDIKVINILTHIARIVIGIVVRAVDKKARETIKDDINKSIKELEDKLTIGISIFEDLEEIRNDINSLDDYSYTDDKEGIKSTAGLLIEKILFLTKKLGIELPLL